MGFIVWLPCILHCVQCVFIACWAIVVDRGHYVWQRSQPAEPDYIHWRYHRVPCQWWAKTGRSLALPGPIYRTEYVTVCFLGLRSSNRHLVTVALNSLIAFCWYLTYTSRVSVSAFPEIAKLLASGKSQVRRCSLYREKSPGDKSEVWGSDSHPFYVPATNWRND